MVKTPSRQILNPLWGDIYQPTLRKQPLDTINFRKKYLQTQLILGKIPLDTINFRQNTLQTQLISPILLPCGHNLVPP